MLRMPNSYPKATKVKKTKHTHTNLQKINEAKHTEITSLREATKKT